MFLNRKKLMNSKYLKIAFFKQNFNKNILNYFSFSKIFLKYSTMSSQKSGRHPSSCYILPANG